MSMVQPKQTQFEPKNEGQKVHPFGLRDKFGYLFGDLGNDFFFMSSKFLFNGFLHRYFWD